MGEENVQFLEKMLKNDQQLTKNLNRKPVNITRQCQKNSRCNKADEKFLAFTV